MIETSDTLDLKCENPYFSEIWNGDKEFEVRKNDRNYHTGQLIRLNEYNRTTNSYSGRSLLIHVKYLLPGGQWGIDPGYCVFGFNILRKMQGSVGCDVQVSLDRNTYEWLRERALQSNRSIEDVAKEDLQEYRDSVAYRMKAMGRVCR